MGRYSDGSGKDAVNTNIVTGNDFLTTVDVEQEVTYRDGVENSNVSEKEVTSIGKEDAPISKTEKTAEQESFDTFTDTSSTPILSLSDIYRYSEDIDWDMVKDIYQNEDSPQRKSALTNLLAKSAGDGIRNGNLPYVDTICDIVGSDAVNEHFPNAATETLREYKLGSSMDKKALAAFGKNELLPMLKRITPDFGTEEVILGDGTTEMRTNSTPHVVASDDAKEVFRETETTRRQQTVADHFTEENMDNLTSIYRSVKEHI